LAQTNGGGAMIRSSGTGFPLEIYISFFDFKLSIRLSLTCSSI